ncbi:hypothetical protein VCRA213O314_180063 [Vibrio crassostreae]|nr:hypothetical protein VCRA213O314_180063 [Vibrio crassostreae]
MRFFLMFTEYVELESVNYNICNFVTKNNITLYFIYSVK